MALISGLKNASVAGIMMSGCIVGRERIVQLLNCSLGFWLRVWAAAHDCAAGGERGWRLHDWAVRLAIVGGRDTAERRLRCWLDLNAARMG